MFEVCAKLFLWISSFSLPFEEKAIVFSLNCLWIFIQKYVDHVHVSLSLSFIFSSLVYVFVFLPIAQYLWHI